MQIVHHQHVKNRRPWISLHVVSGPWTSIVAALDKGQSNIAVCRRYKHVVRNWDGPDAKAFAGIYKSNWVCSVRSAPHQTGRTTYHGSCWASARRPGKMTTPPRSGSVRLTTHVTWPILDSPELPSEQFIEQFSKALSAAEDPTTRHNRRRPAAAAEASRCPRPDSFRLAGRTCLAARLSPLQPL
jgi:hypothetical protein